MTRLFFCALMPVLLLAQPANARLLASCTNIKGKVYALNDKPGWTNQRAPIKSIYFYKNGKKPLEIFFDDGYATRNLTELGARISVPHAARNQEWFLATATYKQMQLDNFQLIFDEKGKGRLVWTRMRMHMPPLDRSDTAMFIGQCMR